MPHNITQWKTIHYEQGEEPIADIMTRFRDAWVLALPYPQCDGKEWHIEDRDSVEERFAAGETSVLVGWSVCHTAHVEIQKVTGTLFY
jgi:hypothetical protein